MPNDRDQECPSAWPYGCRVRAGPSRSSVRRQGTRLGGKGERRRSCEHREEASRVVRCGMTETGPPLR